MKDREVVHVVSHSHWDREWYLPYEEYRMRLIELIDDLIILFQKDTDFKSFHLDGQSIILDDYLEIRPQNKDVLKELICDGKLIVGPYYILQDSFLITSEMHIRNSLIGYLETKKWGKEIRIGYFPDTFGNVGQIPQILKQLNTDTVFFGRGVKPIGFNNSILEDYKFQSQFSEMIWRGADGSEVLGILFANWYSNGNEIPVDKLEAKKYWDRKLKEVRKFASTSHYLLMNGCDHQPVQKNLSEALRVAKELYPNIEFIHDSLPNYVQALKNSTLEDLSIITNELVSQETDGWYTLANTASSRIYLKQENDSLANLLERVLEPLIVMTNRFDLKDQLMYAWKLLLQNSPHDSICGCSIDAVHKEMEIRFQKVSQLLNYLIDECINSFSKNLYITELGTYFFTVLNPGPEAKTDIVNVELVLDSSDFRDGKIEDHYQKMKSLELPKYKIVDENGKEYPSIIEDLGVSFTYDLPKDKFRSAQFSRKIKVSMVVKDMGPFSWKTFKLRELSRDILIENIIEKSSLENKFYKFEISDKNQLNLLLKKQNKKITNVLYFEDYGDLGNEYVFKAPQNDVPIISKVLSLKIINQTSEYVEGEIIHEIEIPISMEKTLKEEQEKIVEFRDRISKRSQTKTIIKIKTKILLFKDCPQIRFESNFLNSAEDHRLRVVFKSGLSNSYHYADSIFELVKRENKPNTTWENPSYVNRYRNFVSLSNNKTALTISSVGIHEYEILDDKNVAITLLRSVVELGDWGYFPTPDAQCKRQFCFQYALEWHDECLKWDAYHRSFALQGKLLSFQTYHSKGELLASSHLIDHWTMNNKEIFITSLKPSVFGDDKLLRYMNFSNRSVELLNKDSQFVNFLEQLVSDTSHKIKGHEIKTEII